MPAKWYATAGVKIAVFQGIIDFGLARFLDVVGAGIEGDSTSDDVLSAIKSYLALPYTGQVWPLTDAFGVAV
ncbi:hypothetical protein MMPV_001434 [Pyropia vietnamensis]